jgi:hypothetical protein
MSNRLRLVAGRASLALLVTAAAVLLVDGGSPASPSVLVGYGVSGGHAPADEAVDAGSAARVFRISGAVAGLYPGKTRRLVLTVSNHLKRPLTVTSITTRVGKPSNACARRYLTVSTFHGSLHVPAGQQARATVSASLSHSAPNGCQGVHFPLRYSGQGQVP